MRVILSRKGMDSGKTGKDTHGRRIRGIPSPIFRADGRMLSLPIGGSGCRMNELSFEGLNLGTIVKDLSNERLSSTMDVHRDPDLYHGLIRRPRNWRPAFGQANGDVTHLEDNGVRKGDLFLFFGWFREIERTRVAGIWKWQYVHGAPDLQVIFGWLQVGDIVRLPDKDKEKSDEEILDTARRQYPWLTQHDHFRKERRWKKNAIYVSTEHLKIGTRVSKIEGGGAFSHFSRELQLTSPDAKGRSQWTLPLCFWSDRPGSRISRHEDPKRWRRNSNGVILQSVARGQEFVVDCDRCPGVEDWALSLIRNNTGRVIARARKG